MRTQQGEGGANLRRRTWEIVQAAKPGDTLSRGFDILILTVIFLNVVAVVLDSVPTIHEDWATFLEAFEILSVFIFTTEYFLRIWSCTEDPRYAHPVRGRIRYAVTPMALIDLLVIAPFFLPFVGADLRSLRALRLLRILRLAKLGRYTSSFNIITKVFNDRKEELVLTLIMMGMLLIVSASLLYYCENPEQPDVYSSIPATMWWAVATLTTVGYGDIYPITLLGKILASISAIVGIGMFALPTGILGAGFVEEVQQRRKGIQKCPHCGKDIS